MFKLNLEFDELLVIFETDVPVLVNHLNYGNHLGYDALLSMLQEARMRWLKTNSLSETNITKNIGYLIKDVALTYESEAFHGDQLRIRIYADDIKSRSFVLNYSVMNLTRKSLVAIAKTSHICYDFENKKVASIPMPLVDMIACTRGFL